LERRQRVAEFRHHEAAVRLGVLTRDRDDLLDLRLNVFALRLGRDDALIQDQTVHQAAHERLALPTVPPEMPSPLSMPHRPPPSDPPDGRVIYSSSVPVSLMPSSPAS